MYPLHVSARTSSDASLHRPLPFTQSQRFIDPAKNIIFSNNGANFLTPIDDQLPFATHEPMSGSHDAESGPDGGFDMSDAQIKKNVRENVPGLAFIGALRPVTYRLDIAGLQARQQPNPNTVADARYSTTHTTKKPRITGFIAQEVASAAERIGFEFSGIDKPDSPEELYALRYSTFVVPLVKATQEQQE
ncbi:MAG: tail fiber domain-containing protein [Saprospiraceae bacterium]|nr:tail fiber domain-containing protein [Saprospiraceae bacterium]